MNKDDRIEIFKKYNGRCAYCGTRIDYKEMQVDHLIPKRLAEIGKVSWDVVNNDNNLMPSCRKCNHYKRGNSLETFRTMIREIPKKLYRDNYIFKIGELYENIVADYNKPIKFYFEKIDERFKHVDNIKVNENKTCGNCAYSIEIIAFGNSKSFVKCNCQEHIDKYCKTEISKIRARTNPACKNHYRENF